MPNFFSKNLEDSLWHNSGIISGQINLAENHNK